MEKCRWFHLRRGIIFEAGYKRGRIHAIIFGGTLKLKKGGTLEIKLRNELDGDLGVKLSISRKLLKGCGEAFLRALGSKKEIAISAGAGFIW